MIWFLIFKIAELLVSLYPPTQKPTQKDCITELQVIYVKTKWGWGYDQYIKSFKQV